MSGMKYAQLEDIPLLKRGKVRDVYDLQEHLLIVVSDRVSAFDVIFEEVFSGKGIILNQLSNFWFDFTKDVVKNHVVSHRIEDYPKKLHKYGQQLEGRSVLVQKIKMIDVECVVRGYLEGSGLKDYRQSGQISGVPLPSGLQRADALPRPIFTPSTKAFEGHDESIGFEELRGQLGDALAGQLKSLSLQLYEKAAAYARTKGLILADTKFEFGQLNGEIILADEILTPDSSRFWDAKTYQPGRAQDSYDKQFLRNFLEQTDWNKQTPAPNIPQEVEAVFMQKYQEAYQKLVGKSIRF